MILHAFIDTYADGQKVFGTITEIGTGYCVVTDSLGKQYHLRNTDIPPTHRAWVYPEYSFRAVDKDGSICYFTERPYIVNDYDWASNGMCKDAGRYNNPQWLGEYWMHSIQHCDEI